jgi:DNA repair photolyase
MITNPIYKPKGAALEYADYALNIYTECPHGCWYCYARQMAKRFGHAWTGDVKPRDGIIKAVKKQLSKGKIKGETIHLCFTCDPYPRGHETYTINEIIWDIKNSGNNVQILTKNISYAEGDFYLLDNNDWVGITNTGNPISFFKRQLLKKAYDKGINTFISFEPILDYKKVLELLPMIKPFITRVAFGKLNHHKEAQNYNWKIIGMDLSDEASKLGFSFYIKNSLKKEMEK